MATSIVKVVTEDAVVLKTTRITDTKGFALRVFNANMEDNAEQKADQLVADLLEGIDTVIKSKHNSNSLVFTNEA